MPDPYQSWSGAPKHWVEVPLQRQGPPDPEELAIRPRVRGAWRCRTERCQALRYGTAGHHRAEWAVAALALIVALAAFVLIGLGGSVADADGPPPPGTSGPLTP